MRFVLLFLIVFSPVIALASTFKVEAPKLIGVGEDISPVVFELIKTALEEEGQSVVTKDGDYKIFSKLMKLQSSYILSIRKVHNSSSVAKKMKINKLDDLDKATSRVVKAVLSERSVNKTANVKNITEEEKVKLQQKIEPTRNWIFGIGPAWYRDLDTTQAKALVLGYAWGLDYNFDLVAKYEFSYANDSNLDSRSDLASLGGSYYLIDDNHAPYLTADFGFGSIATDDDDVTGWGLGFGAGYKFFRTSSVNFSFELKYSIFDSKIDKERPSIIALKANIYF